MNYRHNDYSERMPQLDFEYDSEYYPDDKDLPDPQINPYIPYKVVLDKVGVSGVDLPIKLMRRDGTIQVLHSRVSLYGSLDNPNAKGLNLSRFPILMHEKIADHLSIDGLKDVLLGLQSKQGSNSVYCKMAFKYPWTQEALRTRQELYEEDYLIDNIDYRIDQERWDRDLFKTVEGVHLSHRKMVGHIFYDCILEGQLHKDQFKFFLTVNYIYSSTCPCSFELAQDATKKRGVAANGHSQRSIAKITIQFDPSKHEIWIEDLVELCRKQIPTEVVVICKRRDEQAFAELNGSNLLFTEDSIRLLYQGLDRWYNEGKVQDFNIVTDHLESLHNWNATAVTSKGIPGGLR
jgi:GTP cyclohydrolase I